MRRRRLPDADYIFFVPGLVSPGRLLVGADGAQCITGRRWPRRIATRSCDPSGDDAAIARNFPNVLDAIINGHPAKYIQILL